MVESESTPLLSSCFFLCADFPCHPSPRESSLLEISHSKPSILCPSVCSARRLQSVSGYQKFFNKHYSVRLQAYPPPASSANTVSIPSTAASTFGKNKLSIPPLLCPTAAGNRHYTSYRDQDLLPRVRTKTALSMSRPVVARRSNAASLLSALCSSA